MSQGPSLTHATNVSTNAVPLANASQICDSYDTYIFDADGVLWLGSIVVPGAVVLLAQLMARNKRIIILTNNSTKSPQEYVEKCAKLGFLGIGSEHIVSAGIVTAHEIKKIQANRPEIADLPIYLFGSYGLKNYLEKETGVECIGCGPDHLGNYTNDTFLMNVDMSRKVFAVVASFDPHLSYVKMMKAVNYLKDESIAFIVTNEDLTFPGSVPGVIVPGAGTVSVPLRAISGREPIVMGKPHKAAFKYIQEKYIIDPRRTLMIGDRCDTDISFGNQNHIDTLLVLTGVHSLKTVEEFRKKDELDCIPKMYADSVQDLLT